MLQVSCVYVCVYRVVQKWKKSQRRSFVEIRMRFGKLFSVNDNLIFSKMRFKAKFSSTCTSLKTRRWNQVQAKKTFKIFKITCWMYEKEVLCTCVFATM